jgi:hypothetical protein
MPDTALTQMSRPRTINPLDFTATQGRKKTGRKRLLQPWQESIIRRAVRVRRKLTNKALAARFNISESAFLNYTRGRHKPW